MIILTAMPIALHNLIDVLDVQAKSNGLLEVTVLISGHHRKRNVPGAAFGRAKRNLMLNARNLISPASSSNASPSVVALHNTRRDLEQM